MAEEPRSDVAATRKGIPDRQVEISAVALLRHGPGGPEVLISRRRPDAVRGGLWELPGGKLDPGEDHRSAAARELAEETGVTVDATSGIIVGRVEQFDAHVARERSIAITLVRFDCPAGAEPRPLASAECRWERIDRLDAYDWPTANARLNEMLAASIRA